jgi:hypothetical protein
MPTVNKSLHLHRSLPNVDHPKVERIERYRIKWFWFSLVAQCVLLLCLYMLGLPMLGACLFMCVLLASNLIWFKISYPEKILAPWLKALWLHPFLFWETISILLVIPTTILTGIAHWISWLGGLHARYGVLVLLIVLIGYLLMQYRRSHHQVRIRYYHLSQSAHTSSQSKAWATIAHISDLHICNLTDKSFLTKQCERILQEKPEIIALTGDYVMFGSAFHRDLFEVLSILKAPLGVYAILGNHDYFTNTQALLSGFQSIGIQTLLNQAVDLQINDKIFRIAGVYGDVDQPKRHRENLLQSLQGLNKADFVCMLAHDPSAIEQVKALKIDLMLSGHTHAGQLAWPGKPHINLAAKKYRFSQSIYTLNRTKLIVASALGITAHMPIRIATQAEMGLITVDESMTKQL